MRPMDSYQTVGPLARSSVLLFFVAGTGCAAGSLLQGAAQQAAESEARSLVDQRVRNAIRCVVDDPTCVERSAAAGEDVVFVDENGEVITDDAGEPITDREQALAKVRGAAGEGSSSGGEVLFLDDYGSAGPGEFPGSLELVDGSWDVIEAGGQRYLRATSSGSVKIPLPETLPDRFTVLFEVSLPNEDGRIALTPGPIHATSESRYAGSVVSVGLEEAGVARVGDAGPESLAGHEHDFRIQGAARLRVVADGGYLEVNVGDRLVASAADAVFPRTDALYLVASGASEDRPTLIGPVRIERSKGP